MHLWIYLVSITSLSLGILRLVQAQDSKPFFFIDFIDESFLPEPENTKLEENILPLEPQARAKPLKTNEDKIKKDSISNVKLSKLNSSLKDEPSKKHNIPNVGDFLLAKAENNSIFNETGDEFLLIEDFFSIFNDSQPSKDMKEERHEYTVPPAVTDISVDFELKGEVPLHRMYLRAISSLVQYVMDTLFSFTESASSRFCEPPVSDYDMKPHHRKINKRDLMKAESGSDANTDTTSKNIVTSDALSSTAEPTEVDQKTTLVHVSTAEKNSSEDTTLNGTSENAQHTSPKLTETTESKVHNVKVEHSVVTDGTQSIRKSLETHPTDSTGSHSTVRVRVNHAEEFTHDSLADHNHKHNHNMHNLPHDGNMLADYIPVSFAEKNQKGMLDDQEIYELQRTVRASIRESSAIEEASTPTETFAVTVMIVIVVAMVFGATVLAFAVRKTFYNLPPAAGEQISIANPLSTLA